MPCYCGRGIQNGVLSALPEDEYLRLLPNLKLIKLSFGHVLYEANSRLESAYFPTTSVISLVYTMKDGATAELGTVGRDGILGLPIVLGGTLMPSSAVTQIAGEAVSVKARVLRDEICRGGELLRLLLSYTQAFITQLSQTAVCNRLHSIEQRLCRWLLLCQDRTDSSEFFLTQEFIAQMLGARRESVTVAAGHLQDEDLIQYCRGHIRIINRRGLEANACECYEVIRTNVWATATRKL